MTRLLGIVVAATTLATATHLSAEPTCAPLGLSPEMLRDAQANRFSTIEDSSVAAFLEGVPDCLSSLDPFYRDLIGYEGTATLLRRNEAVGSQRAAALRSLRGRLFEQLDSRTADPEGVTKPFAAIVLAEVARTDRISPWMSPDERRNLVAVASRYLAEIDDYRAFEDGVGFRHGVAHGADLALQLALNASVPPEELAPLVGAIAAQIAPPKGVAYVTGEPDRLARALFYLMQRTANSEPLRQSILALLDSLQDPAPYASWESVFTSEAALNFRHNRRSFARALYLLVDRRQEPEPTSPFKASLDAAISAIP